MNSANENSIRRVLFDPPARAMAAGTAETSLFKHPPAEIVALAWDIRLQPTLSIESPGSSGRSHCAPGFDYSRFDSRSAGWLSKNVGKLQRNPLDNLS